MSYVPPSVMVISGLETEKTRFELVLAVSDSVTADVSAAAVLAESAVSAVVSAASTLAAAVVCTSVSAAVFAAAFSAASLSPTVATLAIGSPAVFMVSVLLSHAPKMLTHNAINAIDTGIFFINIPLYKKSLYVL
jgi:hypothetical protein